VPNVAIAEVDAKEIGIRLGWEARKVMADLPARVASGRRRRWIEVDSRASSTPPHPDRRHRNPGEIAGVAVAQPCGLKACHLNQL
jgi:hypothetical protein